MGPKTIGTKKHGYDDMPSSSSKFGCHVSVYIVQSACLQSVYFFFYYHILMRVSI